MEDVRYIKHLRYEIRLRVVVLENRVFTSSFAVRVFVRLFLFTAVFVLLLWCLAGTSLLTLENIN